MWTHTVLELYPNNGELPTEGEPADWIDQRLVSWCQGHDDVVIYYAPLWWILWIKIKKYADNVHSAWINHLWSKTPWWKRRTKREWDEIMADVIDEDTIIVT